MLLMLGYITDANGELYGDVAKRLLLYTDTQAMMDRGLSHLCDTWWVIHYTRYAKVMGLRTHILIKYDPGCEPSYNRFL